MTLEDSSVPGAVSSLDLASCPSFSLTVDGGNEHQHGVELAPVSMGPLLARIAAQREWKQQRKPKSLAKSWTGAFALYDYYVGRLEGASLQSQFCYVRTAEGRFITESIRPMGPEEAARRFRDSPPAEPPRSPEGFLIGSDLISNYTHWLTQAMPTVEFVPGTPGRRTCKIVMGEPKSWQLRTLELAGFDRSEIEIMPPGRVRTYDVLHYTYSGIGQYHGFRRNLRPFFDGMRRRATLSGGGPLRLYVSRRDTERRPMRNEAELEAALADRGFTVIRPGELTTDQQIDAFSRAGIVVGPHGAGLANVVFCRPGTPVYELHPSQNALAHYFRLTQYFGLPYWGDCFPAEDVPAASPELIGWSVDLPYVLGRVEECMAFHAVPQAAA